MLVEAPPGTAMPPCQVGGMAASGCGSSRCLPLRMTGHPTSPLGSTTGVAAHGLAALL